MDLIQTLAYSLVRVLRYFMPRESQIECPHPALSPLRGADRDSDSETYGNWSRHLILYYHNATQDVKDWIISEMRWFKNKGRLEHEYVVFTIQKSAEPAIELFLRFDRRSTSTVLAREKTSAIIKPEDFENLSEEEKTTLTNAVNEEAELLSDRHYLIHTLKKFSSSDHGVEADDTVTHTYYPNGLTQATPEQAELLATFSHFQKPFYLRDLAIITRDLSEYSDTYLLLLQQCYWMGRTIVNTVVELYRPQPPQGITTPAFARAGCLSVASFLGKINKDNPQEVARLVKTIKASIARDDEEIETARRPERQLHELIESLRQENESLRAMTGQS